MLIDSTLQRRLSRGACFWPLRVGEFGGHHGPLRLWQVHSSGLLGSAWHCLAIRLGRACLHLGRTSWPARHLAAKHALCLYKHVLHTLCYSHAELRKSSKYSGTIHLNGRPRDYLFPRVTAYVPQEEAMPKYLTVMEAGPSDRMISDNRDQRRPWSSTEV